jgi:hypothetical protein
VPVSPDRALGWLAVSPAGLRAARTAMRLHNDRVSGRIAFQRAHNAGERRAVCRISLARRSAPIRVASAWRRQVPSTAATTARRRPRWSCTATANTPVVTELRSFQLPVSSSKLSSQLERTSSLNWKLAAESLGSQFFIFSARARPCTDGVRLGVRNSACSKAFAASPARPASSNISPYSS